MINVGRSFVNMLFHNWLCQTLNCSFVAISLIAQSIEGEFVFGISFLNGGGDDAHRDVVHNGGSGCNSGSGNRSQASQHQHVTPHEPLVHQIPRLLPHFRKQRWPSRHHRIATRLGPILRRPNQSSTIRSEVLRSLESVVLRSLYKGYPH